LKKYDVTSLLIRRRMAPLPAFQWCYFTVREGRGNQAVPYLKSGYSPPTKLSFIMGTNGKSSYLAAEQILLDFVRVPLQLSLRRWRSTFPYICICVVFSNLGQFSG